MRESDYTVYAHTVKEKEWQSLTFVFVRLVQGQVLQQVFIDGEWTASRHLLYGVDAEAQ